MDLYRTDSSFLPLAIIDKYESLVWTDRFKDHGDFELITPWDPDLTRDLRSFKYLLHSESDRIMMVETVDKDKQNKNLKGNLVKVTGRSLEAFFTFRDNRRYGFPEPIPKVGSRGQIVNDFVTGMCITNSVNPEDNLPGLSVGTPPSTGSITIQVERGTLYDIIKSVIDGNPDLGFKLYRTPTPGELIFQVYEGADYSGYADPDIYKEFSPDNESLVEISSLESVANYKNWMLIIGSDQQMLLQRPDPPYGDGFDRRVVAVEAYDIGTDTTTTYAENGQALNTRAYQLLISNENTYIQLVDGQIPQNVHVELGDILWVQDSFGMKTRVRITEKIWTSDATGNKYLPTFEAV